MNPEAKRPKIAYLSAWDTRDMPTWSGIPLFMGQALQKHCGEVHYIRPIKTYREYGLKIFNKVSQLVLKKAFYHWHSLFVAKKYAGIAGQQIAALAPDVIFAPTASAEIAFLETDIPIIYTSDGPLGAMLEYYDGYSNLVKVSLRQGNVIETRAIEKASILTFPSQWAAEAAVNYHHTDKNKFHIIPFGAKLEEIPARQIVLRRKKSPHCRLLFPGVGSAGKKRRRYSFRNAAGIGKTRDKSRAHCL